MLEAPKYLHYESCNALFVFDFQRLVAAAETVVANYSIVPPPFDEVCYSLLLGPYELRFMLFRRVRCPTLTLEMP